LPQRPVNLGTAKSFAVLAGTTITNTGATTITGDVGVHPGKTATGFTTVTLHGAKHLGDAVALSAKNSLVTAYNDAAGAKPVTNVPAELGGTTLKAGVYASATLGLTGTLTLDGTGVFIFQAGSTLITAPNSKVALINGASACNVYWQVGSSATLDTSTKLQGHDHGPHLDRAQDRRNAAGPGAGAERCRHHGPQHHQQLGVCGAQCRAQRAAGTDGPAERHLRLDARRRHRPGPGDPLHPPRHRRDRVRRLTHLGSQPIPPARLIALRAVRITARSVQPDRAVIARSEAG